MCVFVTYVCIRTGSALALLYGTSATLEHHHFNHAVMILQSEVHHVLISAAVQLASLFVFFNAFNCFKLCKTFYYTTNAIGEKCVHLPFNGNTTVAEVSLM